MKKNFLVGFVILLIEASMVFLIRQNRGFPSAVQLEPNKIKGNLNAPISITVFSDFVCPFCGAVRNSLDRTLKAYPQDVKIIFKHFPLSTHRTAPMAAEASECAADQGRFWDYHDVLFDNVGEWYKLHDADLSDQFVAYATRLKMDSNQFRECMVSGSKKEIVEQNKKEGKGFMVQGTPTVILNNKKIITNPLQFSFIKPHIEEELRRYHESK